MRPPHPEDLDVAAGRLEEPFEDFDRRRFPGAVRAEEPKALAATDVQIKAAYGDDPAVVLLDEGAAMNGERGIGGQGAIEGSGRMGRASSRLRAGGAPAGV